MNELYVCPNCRTAGNIETINPLVGNVRYDTVSCPKCGCSWRVYYEVGAMRAEVVSQPATDTEVANKDVETTEEA